MVFIMSNPLPGCFTRAGSEYCLSSRSDPGIFSTAGSGSTPLGSASLCLKLLNGFDLKFLTFFSKFGQIFDLKF